MRKFKLIEKYNFGFAFFIVAIFLILILNIFSLKFYSKSKEAVEIYFADNISESHQFLITKFNERYEGKIKVIPVNLPWAKFNTNQRKDLIARTLRSENTKIDIYAIDQVWVGRFEKWAEPLDDYFTEVEVSGIIPELRKICIINNQLMSIPMYCDIGILAYKKNIIKQIPGHEEIIEKLNHSIAWDELIEFLQNNGIGENSYLFQGDAYEGLICNLLEIYGSMYDKKFPVTREEILSDDFINSITFLKDLIYKYQITPKDVVNYTEHHSYKNFLDYKSLFIRRWYSGIHNYNTYNTEPKLLDDLTACPLPHFSNRNFKAVFGGWNLMIGKSSHNKKEAIKFLKFILEETSQKSFNRIAGYLPVISSCYQDSTINNYFPNFSLLDYIKHHGIHRSSYSNYTKESDILSYYINKALRNEMTIQEALNASCDIMYSNELFIK